MTTTSINCACGKPLHYTDGRNRELVEKLIVSCGEYLTVCCRLKKYRVQRHFIALHGLNAQDLESLAAQGIVERVEDEV